MSARRKNHISVTAGMYTFTFSNRSMIAIPRIKTRRNRNEKELQRVAKAYEEYKQAVRPIGRPLNGEWRWCINPECYNAFYASGFRMKIRMKKGKGLCCSRRCAGKVFGAQKGEQVGRQMVVKAVR